MFRFNVDKIGAVTTIAGGVLGMLASFVLSIESMVLIGSDGGTLSCDINTIISCSTVAQSSSAMILGFPNSFIGMMSFPVLITIGVILFLGVKLPGWFLKATTIGIGFGLVFAGWMFYQSFVVIGALCPWCLLTDLGMLLASFGVFRHLTKNKLVWFSKLKWIVDKNYDVVTMFSILVTVVALVVFKFGSALWS